MTFPKGTIVIIGFAPLMLTKGTAYPMEMSEAHKLINMAKRCHDDKRELVTLRRRQIRGVK